MKPDSRVLMYAKLFSREVLMSSLTQYQPVENRGVFFMLLAAADKSGYVLGDDEAIARIINVPMDTFSKALAALMATDPKSKSKEYEGRRIVRLDDSPGLLIVNYEKYSGIGSDEQRREYFRIKKAESRARARAASNGSQDPIESDSFHKDSRTVLHLLNEASGRKFRETDTNLGFISARLSESGVDLEGVKKMIYRQCQMWKATELEEYLRPETLFNKTKFDGYYAAKDLPISKNEHQNNPPSKPLQHSQPNNGF